MAGHGPGGAGYDGAMSADRSTPHADAAAIVLFAHGARDPAWAAPLTAVADAIGRDAPGVAVRIAFLEMQSPSLPQVLDELATAGASRIAVLPVFWAAAGHVQTSLPPMIEAARVRHPAVRLSVLPVLSGLPGVVELIAREAVRAVGLR